MKLTLLLIITGLLLTFIVAVRWWRWWNELIPVTFPCKITAGTQYYVMQTPAKIYSAADCGWEGGGSGFKLTFGSGVTEAHILVRRRDYKKTTEYSITPAPMITP